MIEATTDQTGGAVVGSEDLTVIWMTGSFRGSAEQGAALTACSSAKFTTASSWSEDKVGLFVYNAIPIPGYNKTALWNQMEVKFTPAPLVVLPNLVWDIKREISRVIWAGSTASPLPRYSPPGGNGWGNDDPDDLDEDLVQQEGCKEIFSIDAPGVNALPWTAGWRCTIKGKFREWVEVKIGSKWYVCSDYVYWRIINHVKFKDPTDKWVLVADETNEVVKGTIKGCPVDWSE